MWPLDRIGAREYLRIGRFSAERWTGSASTLALVGCTVLPASSGLDAQTLRTAIQALYPTKPKAAVTILLESVWLPLLLVEVGTSLWNRTQVEPLVRHRFEILHGGSDASMSGWDLRVDYRVAERYALGFGMAPRLRESLVDVGRAAGLRWAGLLPAFAWGLQHLGRARRRCGGSAWWVWPEQDRLLVARIVSNRVVALNAGAPLSEDAALITRMVDVENLRCGMNTSSDPICAATWSHRQHPARTTDRLQWMAIAGRTPSHEAKAPIGSPTTARP